MNYQEVTENFDGTEQKHIWLKNADGSITSFPAKNDNPRFIAFLQEAQKENDPYFTEWVEAGNDPDEFWSQDSGL